MELSPLAMGSRRFPLGQYRAVSWIGRAAKPNVIDQDELWFEGTDMSNNQFVSARLTRDWVREQRNWLTD
jgi:hypothetical protein